MALKGVCEVVGAEVSQRYVELLFCVAATVAVRRPAPLPGSRDLAPGAHVTKLMAEQVPQVRPLQHCQCFRRRARLGGSQRQARTHRHTHIDMRVNTHTHTRTHACKTMPATTHALTHKRGQTLIIRMWGRRATGRWERC